MTDKTNDIKTANALKNEFVTNINILVSLLAKALSNKEPTLEQIKNFVFEYNKFTDLSDEISDTIINVMNKRCTKNYIDKESSDDKYWNSLNDEDFVGS